MHSKQISQFKYLDPRPAKEAAEKPIFEAVNIPLNELEYRTYELPAKREIIKVVGDKELQIQTIKWILEHGRTALECDDLIYAASPQYGRLWLPSSLLEDKINDLPPGRALDLGCGAGRDAVYLASVGWDVTAIDHLADAVEMGKKLEARYNLNSINWVVEDINVETINNIGTFDLIIMFYYMNKTILSLLPNLLNENGHLIIETFSEKNRELNGKPKSKDSTIDFDEIYFYLSELKTINLSSNNENNIYTTRYIGIKKASRKIEKLEKPDNYQVPISHEAR